MKDSNSSRLGGLTPTEGAVTASTGLFTGLTAKPGLRAVAAAAFASMLVLVGGCGSSKPDAAPTTTPTAPATVAADLAAAINARLDAQNGPLASPSSDASIQTAAEVRTDSGGKERAADTLDAAGTQNLKTKDGNHGIRVVFHFPDAAKAMASYRRATRDSAGSKTAFTISGVPNSSATDDSIKAGCGCRSVDFVIGDYEYRFSLSTDMGDSPTRAQFIAMTRAWYDKLQAMG